MDGFLKIKPFYSNKQTQILKTGIDAVLNEIKYNVSNNKTHLFPNQINTSKKILDRLEKDEILNVLVLGKTQSGKTGTMLSFINEYLKKHIIPIEHIYIITGLSDNEWVKQTKSRMPLLLRERVYHRARLMKEFKNDVKGKTNILLLIDENHIASQMGQTLNLLFRECGFYDLKTLCQNHIQIVEFTATPNGTLYDILQWGQHSSVIQMNNGQKYVGFEKLMKDNRIIQYEHLLGFDKKENKYFDYRAKKNIRTLQQIINTKWLNSPKYHIIRNYRGAKGTKLLGFFYSIFRDTKTDIYQYDQNNRLKLDDMLSKKPIRHTFIFLKEKLRCAKTLVKTYLGICYERCIQYPQNDVIIQGLVGRCTGYDDNGETIIFTDVDSVKRYIEMWNVSFKDTSLAWRSSSTFKLDDEMQSNKTYLHPSYIQNMIVPPKKIKHDINKIPFNTFDLAKNYCIQMFSLKRGPNKPRKSKHDPNFYTKRLQNICKIWSVKEIEDMKFRHSKKFPTFICIPCYQNISDPNTIKFMIVHY